MKITLLIIFFNFIASLGFSQYGPLKYDSIQKMYYKTDGKDSILFETPPNTVFRDRMPPAFIGNMEKFITDNLVYPEEARKRKLEGYVNIYCTINSKGIPTKILVMYATSPLFEKEAERIVSLMRWKWDEKEPFREYWAESVKIVFEL